jgi:hypothetical protein
VPRYADATMVVRTQITLDAETHTRAKQRAAELGVSLAEYVRRLVDADLAEPAAAKADISEIFGMFDSGGSNIARYKGQYVAEAIMKVHKRS